MLKTRQKYEVIIFCRASSLRSFLIMGPLCVCLCFFFIELFCLVHKLKKCWTIYKRNLILHITSKGKWWNRTRTQQSKCTKQQIYTYMYHWMCTWFYLRPYFRWSLTSEMDDMSIYLSFFSITCHVRFVCFLFNSLWTHISIPMKKKNKFYIFKCLLICTT